MAWGGLREHIAMPAYQSIVNEMHEATVQVALTLPNPNGLGVDLLKKAAEEEASLEEMIRMVRLFQWLLPGLVTNIAFFRAQFE